MSPSEIEVGTRDIRSVQQDIESSLTGGNALIVRNPLSRHNLGIGLSTGANVRFAGSVGYYCGGLNNGAHIRIDQDAGWGTGEGMASGEIRVGGYAGMSTGAAMRGGTIVVEGDAGPRTGVAMKGGQIIVLGHFGSQSGFMAHAGRIIALGGAGAACGDALWQGEVWVSGAIESLGVDAVCREPNTAEIREVEQLLMTMGISRGPYDWKKIVSGQRLWHFESRDANAWLMI